MISKLFLKVRSYLVDMGVQMKAFVQTIWSDKFTLLFLGAMFAVIFRSVDEFESAIEFCVMFLAFCVNTALSVLMLEMKKKKQLRWTQVLSLVGIGSAIISHSSLLEIVKALTFVFLVSVINVLRSMADTDDKNKDVSERPDLSSII